MRSHMSWAPHANPRPEYIATDSDRAKQTDAVLRSRAIRTVVGYTVDGCDRESLLAMLGLIDESHREV